MKLYLNPHYGFTERRVGWRVKQQFNKGHVVSIDGTDVPDRDGELMIDQNPHLVHTNKSHWFNETPNHDDIPEQTEDVEQPQPATDSEKPNDLTAETLIQMAQYEELEDAKMSTLRSFAKALKMTVPATVSKNELVSLLEDKAVELTA